MPAVASLALIIVPLALAAADPRPLTVAQLPPMVDAAVGSRGIAWLTPGSGCPGQGGSLRLLDLKEHRTETIENCHAVLVPPEPAGNRIDALLVSVTVVGDRVVWARYFGGNTEVDGSVLTATVNDRTPRRVASFGFDNCTDVACDAPSIATDGVSVVFALRDEVRKLAGTRSRRLFGGSGDPFGALAIGGGLVAVAHQPLQGNAPTQIELHDFRSGALRRVINAPHAPRFLAVSSTLLATSSGDSIDLYDTKTGRHLAHARGGPPILLDRRAIFGIKNRLQALDADTRRVTTLVHDAYPIGRVALIPASEGARVEWIEYTPRKTVVRALR